MKSKFFSFLNNSKNKTSFFRGLFYFVVGFLLFFKFKSIKKWITSKLRRFDVSDSPFTNGGVLTDKYIQTLSEKLFSAMNWFGTDEKAIEEVYAVITLYPTGLLKVYNAFGNPKYLGFGKNDLLGTPMDLKGWLSKELSRSEFEKWNVLFLKYGI